MIILLLNGYVGDDSFDFAGASSKDYKFKWDKKLTAYTFQPTCQEDADDIFRQNGSLWQLSALCDGVNNDQAPAGAQVSVPKTALPARYYATLDPDEQAELAHSCGITHAKESYGRQRLMELLEAYYLGAGMQRTNPARAAELVKVHATPAPQPVSITAEAIPIVVAPDIRTTTESFGAGAGSFSVNVDHVPTQATAVPAKPKRKYVKNPRGPLVAV